MMEFYDKYLENFDKTPEEEFRELAQMFLDADKHWDNNILQDKIILENSPRTFDYSDNIEQTVYIDSVSEISTNLVKIEGNYVSVVFRDCSYKYERGSCFYRPSNKSYYLVYQSTNDMRSFSKCKAIQCNNIIKWLDIETNEIYSFPCSMGQELTSTTSQDLKFISVANGRTTVMLFNNDKTSKLKINQRLIFNGVPYRINEIKNYEEDNYIDRNVDMLFLYLERSSIEPSDDLVNGIANRYEKDYSLNINQTDIAQVVGFTGTLKATLLLNDKVVDENPNVKWISSDTEVVTIDEEGNFKLFGNVGDSAIITCEFNNELKAETNVNVVRRVASIKELVTIPNDDYVTISKGSSLDIICNLYIDNVKRLADIPYTLTGATGNYTVLDIQDGVRITCINPSSELLNLKFIYSDNLSKEINIKLKGIW